MHAQYVGNQFGIATMDARDILSANLKALQVKYPKYSSAPAIARATEQLGCKVGRTTVQRVLDGTTPVNLDFISAMAKIFGLDPWQLLVPNMQPDNPPVLRSIGPSEDVFYKNLGKLVEDAKVILGES